MKNTFKVVSIAIAAVLVISTAACSGGGKSLNSAGALKAYLDSQPANSPDKPIKITMSANEPMLQDISKTISSAGKYVSLTLSGGALTTIPKFAFGRCTNLVSVTIPNSVTSIESLAFAGCTSLTSVTIPDSVTRIKSAAFVYLKSHGLPYNGTSLTSITIGAGVELTEEKYIDHGEIEGDLIVPSFGKGFESVYINGGQRAGTYTRPDAESTNWTMK